jgi:hypothetical protein
MLFYRAVSQSDLFRDSRCDSLTQQVAEGSKLGSTIGRLIPQSEFGSAVFGIVLTALLAVMETVFSTNGLGNTVGTLRWHSVFSRLELDDDLRFHQPRSLGKCLLVRCFQSDLSGWLCCVRDRRHHLPRDGPPTRHPSRTVWWFDWLRASEARLFDQYVARASVVCLLVPGLIFIEYALVKRRRSTK